ncbi:MAG: DEAD/DEAH box helicase, partial [Eubacteriales bacterium]|nr:DEAD/DEAH box helicase [Eubacteriales bacterium]
ELGFRYVVFDEIQELRHSGTEKYSAASLLAEQAERVVGLSGTPIYNRGAEIWNVVNTLDFHFLGDYESFTREWCYGYGNQIVAKPEVLGEYLRAEGILLRRTKQDVLFDLPPKRRLVMTIDSDDTLYRKLMLPITDKLTQLKHDPELNAAQRALLSMEVEQGERQATGLAKSPYVAQFVRALLDGGEKVLLFAHHHQVMDTYRRELHTFSPAFITGRETGAQKEQSVERFMAGRTDLCCLSLRAASGLNLQRATCVVFGELDWSPAVHSQAEDRAHRMGQTDSILCYYLVSQGGSDQDIQDALGLKVSQFVALMGDQPQEQATLTEDAQFARQYAERLVQRLLDETH